MFNFEIYPTNFFWPTIRPLYTPLILTLAFSTDNVTPTLFSIICGLVVIILSKEIPYKVRSFKNPLVSFSINSFGISIIS